MTTLLGVGRGGRACDADAANAILNIVLMFAGDLDSCGRKLFQGSWRIQASVEIANQRKPTASRECHL